ncbi:MAG: hypothetical protein K6A42_00490 [Treponema sp.]|nr:hypothetical protein [Treponema sp.]
MLEVGKVYGFVSPINFIKGYDGNNEGRFLFLDSKTLLEEPMEAYSTSLHEFSHAISRTKKDLEHGVRWTYWYGELLAMTCEDMMQNYLGFLDTVTDKSASSICHSPKERLSQGNCSAGIKGFTGDDSATYSTAFQFSAWLTRKFGGVKLIKEMAQNAYVDMASIVNAVNAVNGRSYTTESLLEEFAGDLLWEETGHGMNQAAATYSDSAYTCSYTVNGESQTYNYPLTAINLWDPFYVWYGSNLASYAANSSIAFADAPTGNTYRSGTWADGAPRILFRGPFMFKTGNGCANIGPYGYTLSKIGVASSDTVTINFSCAGGYAFRDTLTIWIK